MADRSSRQGFGVLGVGAAACAACCAGPVVAFLAAASVGTLVSVALFGAFGVVVAAAGVVAYLRRRPRLEHPTPTVTPVTLGRTPDG
jgi:hypothetical protein